MRKREWMISLCMLCVLAVCAAGLSAYVLCKNQPENVEAFENRFLDLTTLAFSGSKEMQAEITPDQLMLSWPQGAEELTLETAVQPLQKPCSEWQLDLGGGGTQNARRKERWGYQVWLEMVMLKDGQQLAAQRTELPLEAERADRTRVYTVLADAEGADGWQLRIIIAPVDGGVSEGSLILKNWEVHAR